MTLTIRGLQEAQTRNQRRIAALKPSGALGKAVQWATSEAHRYAVVITHVDVGALRAAHQMRVNGTTGEVYISPSARNPRTDQRPADYGPIEHARGGDHAFYKRTEQEAGPRIAKRAAKMILDGM